MQWLEALMSHDAKRVVETFDPKIFPSPVLYADFLQLPPDGNVYPDALLARYAMGPKKRDLAFTNDHLDPMSPLIWNTVGQLSLKYVGARWFHALFISDPDLYTRMCVIEPFKHAFTSPTGQEALIPNEMAWLLALVNNQLFMPVYPHQERLLELWTHHGAWKSAPPDVFLPDVIYFLFYFRDILTHAKTTLTDYLAGFSQGAPSSLDIRFYFDMAQAGMVDIMSEPVFDSFYVTLAQIYLGQTVNLPWKWDFWTMDECAQLIHALLVTESCDGLMELAEHIHLRLPKEAAQWSTREWMDYAYKHQFHTSDDSRDWDAVRALFKTAPYEILIDMMKEGYPVDIMADSIYDRGFLLHDECNYFRSDKFVLSEVQLQDIILRFRGTVDEALKWIHYCREKTGDVPSQLFWIGMYYLQEAWMNSGASYIRQHIGQYTVCIVDDIILHVNTTRTSGTAAMLQRSIIGLKGSSLYADKIHDQIAEVME